jgi:hypothetical protein
MGVAPCGGAAGVLLAWWPLALCVLTYMYMVLSTGVEELRPQARRRICGPLCGRISASTWGASTVPATTR